MMSDTQLPIFPKSCMSENFANVLMFVGGIVSGH